MFARTQAHSIGESRDSFILDVLPVCVFYPIIDTEGVAKKETHHRRSSIESQQVGGEFADFLKTLKKSAALDISKQVWGHNQKCITRQNHNRYGAAWGCIQ